MANPTIVVHTVVRNEGRWIWFSLNSVLDYVDKIMLWDTGSTDNTIPIIKTINDSRIAFKQAPPVRDEDGLSVTRQAMIEATRADWLMIMDGDEVWPEDSIKAVTRFISHQGQDYDSIVIPTLNCVGDIFHISPPSAGRYRLAGRIGHYGLRFINLNRVKGLHVSNPPDYWQTITDADGVQIQDRDPGRIAFLEAPYMHMTHLLRSTSDTGDASVFWRKNIKFKYMLGRRLPADFSYPKSFYYPRPALVPSPWIRRSPYYIFTALWQTPLKSLKGSLQK